MMFAFAIVVTMITVPIWLIGACALIIWDERPTLFQMALFGLWASSITLMWSGILAS